VNAPLQRNGKKVVFSSQKRGGDQLLLLLGAGEKFAHIKKLGEGLGKFEKGVKGRWVEFSKSTPKKKQQGG